MIDFLNPNFFGTRCSYCDNWNLKEIKENLYKWIKKIREREREKKCNKKEEKRESWQWNSWRKDHAEADREAEHLPEGWKDEEENEEKVITVGERITYISGTIVDAGKEK